MGPFYELISSVCIYDRVQPLVLGRGQGPDMALDALFLNLLRFRHETKT